MQSIQQLLNPFNYEGHSDHSQASIENDSKSGAWKNEGTGGGRSSTPEGITAHVQMYSTHTVGPTDGN